MCGFNLYTSFVEIINLNKKINKMGQSVEKQVEEYVRTNYKNTYGKSEKIFVEETDTVFRITNHKDGSPLILSKGILNK